MQNDGRKRVKAMAVTMMLTATTNMLIIMMLIKMRRTTTTMNDKCRQCATADL